MCLTCVRHCEFFMGIIVTMIIVFSVFGLPFIVFGASQVALGVKNSLANAGNARDAGSVPGSRRSSGEGNGYHSSILAWRIPWTEESGGLQSMGSQRVGRDWACTCSHTLIFKGLWHTSPYSQNCLEEQTSVSYFLSKESGASLLKFGWSLSRSALTARARIWVYQLRVHSLEREFPKLKSTSCFAINI